MGVSEWVGGRERGGEERDPPSHEGMLQCNQRRIKAWQLTEPTGSLEVPADQGPSIPVSKRPSTPVSQGPSIPVSQGTHCLNQALRVTNWRHQHCTQYHLNSGTKSPHCSRLLHPERQSTRAAFSTPLM